MGLLNQNPYYGSPPQRVTMDEDIESEVESESGKEEEVTPVLKSDRRKLNRINTDISNSDGEDQVLKEMEKRFNRLKSPKKTEKVRKTKEPKDQSTPLPHHKKFMDELMKTMSEKIDLSVTKALGDLTNPEGLRRPKSVTRKAKFSDSYSDNTVSSGGSSEPIARTKAYRSKERKDGLELLIETMQLNSTAGDNEVSILDGKTRDPKSLFRHFEMHASIMGWTEATMGKKIVRFLKKEAEGSWKDMKFKERNNYALIKE